MPSAIWSLATNTAVTSRPSAIAAARARSRSAALQSPASGGVRLGAGRLERVPPALDALARLQPVARARDVPDRPVAELEQVARGGRRAGELVDRDDRSASSGPASTATTGTSAGSCAHRVRGRDLRRDDEDAVDALAAQPLDGRRAPTRGRAT